jgi:hypothetical protein
VTAETARSPRSDSRRRRSLSRVAALLIAAFALAGALAYLRDPPWLLGMTSGLRAWETAPDGQRVRWAGAHASFFVPSDAESVRIPLRTTFDRAGEWPIAVAISVDDRSAGRLVLSDSAWRESVIRLPPPGSRRVRRIDIRADRARDDNHAVQLGEITLGAAR